MPLKTPKKIKQLTRVIDYAWKHPSEPNPQIEKSYGGECWYCVRDAGASPNRDLKPTRSSNYLLLVRREQ